MALISYGTICSYFPFELFGDLLYIKPDYLDTKRSNHAIVCGLDALFHVNKGAVAIRAEFVGNLRIEDVTISDITNLGDDFHWLCKKQFLLDNMQTFHPQW